MTRIRTVTLTSCLAATIALCTLSAGVYGCGGSEDTFVVSGTVLASGDIDDGLAGVTARCAGTDVTYVTVQDGRFRLECPMPASETGDSATAAMIWFEHPDFAPVAKTLVPVVDGTYTMAPVMQKDAVATNVDVPTGNTSVPVLLGPLTLSFEKDALLGTDGLALTGNVSMEAGGWDDSLPVEEDESSGKMTTDALYPPWPHYLVNGSEDGVWMRPISAGWFDLAGNSVNPDVPVIFQLFSRFADELVGRNITGSGDANLYFLHPDSPLPTRDGTAALTAVNQIATESLQDGLYVWMAPVPTHACIEVTVQKGEVPATGAQIDAFETFDGDLELFCDEKVGSETGTYCLYAVSGKQVRIQVFVDGTDGLLMQEADVLSGGNASCGGGCATVLIKFPCEINEECADGNICAAGECTALEPA